MPIYEYECELCNSRFEIRRGFNEQGGINCPQCSGTARRVFSPVPIIFKGSGFYINDKREKRLAVKNSDKEPSIYNDSSDDSIHTNQIKCE